MLRNLVLPFIRRLSILVVSLAASFGATGHAEEPPEQPPELRLCISCHGEDGLTSNEQWPHLAAQNAQYLADQSIRYRDGLRYDPNGLMAPWVEDLSDEAIGRIAEYYSRQPAPEPAPAPAEQIAKGRRVAMGCGGCHRVEDGSSINDLWPHLGAQNAGYTEQTLLDYQQGRRRDQTGIMAAFSQDLSAEDIRNVAAYYASLSFGGDAGDGTP